MLWFDEVLIILVWSFDVIIWSFECDVVLFVCFDVDGIIYML